MTNYQRISLIIRACTLITLMGIAIMLGLDLPVLAHAARIYVTMYG